MADFALNGKTYEFVAIDDFTLDELCLLWDYGKLTIDQVADVEVFHPGLIKTLIHVSVARAEPGETAKQIAQVTGSLKVPELLAMWEQISEEVDELPPSRRAKQDRADRFFWRAFLIHWGAAPGSQPAERFRQPWLGHWCNLRPKDLGAMTPAQLEACYAWVKEQEH